MLQYTPIENVQVCFEIIVMLTGYSQVKREISLLWDLFWKADLIRQIKL